MKKRLICLLLLLLLVACARTKPSHVVYGETLAYYVKTLFDEGLDPFGQISRYEVEFITLLSPTTGEVSAQQFREILELVSFTAQVFDASGGLQHEDILITFRRPVHQQIIVINRPDGMPEPIGMAAEASIGMPSRPGEIVSVVNLSGTPKTLGRAYTTDWAVMQAVCLAFAMQDNPDPDAICNIISANGAAGWAGIERDVIQEFLDGGSTELEYLGHRDYEFRFIDFVYDGFLRK